MIASLLTRRVPHPAAALDADAVIPIISRSLPPYFYYRIALRFPFGSLFLAYTKSDAMRKEK